MLAGKRGHCPAVARQRRSPPSHKASEGRRGGEEDEVKGNLKMDSSYWSRKLGFGRAF